MIECSMAEKLKDYVLAELSPAECAEVEQHARACENCRVELDALSVTRAALLSVADEEPPRRIAFVSDKVFEPKWYQRLWNSGPRLGFASAAMLAAAITAHGWMARPLPANAPVPVASSVATEAEIDLRVRTEVAKAVAAAQERHLARTLELVNARLENVESQRREDLLVMRDILERTEKSNKTLIRNAGIYQ